MAENFGDIQRIKNKRGGFMGGVKEVSHVKIPTAKPAEAKVVTPVAAPKPAAEPTKQVVEDKDKTTLKKGFVVGFTEEGIVKLQPFGGIGELELAGLIKYSEVKSDDMMNKIARTSTSDITPIKEGVTILAQSIKTLLTHESGVQAAS